MKNWSSRIGGADPLVRGRRPRWPDGAPPDADVVVAAAGQRGPPAARGAAPPGAAGVVFRPCQSFPHHELSTDDTRRSSVLPRRVTLKFQLHLRPDMSYLSIRDLDLTGKCVFIRVDFNVPLQKNEQGVMEITSDKRIKASLPTIQYALLVL